MTAKLESIAIFLLFIVGSFGSDSEITGNIYPPVNHNNDTVPLYFGLMMSIGGSYDSSGMIPAVQVALDWINNSSLSDILPGHSLHYILYDSKCDRTIALESFFTLAHFVDPPIVALLGSGCSQATAATSEISHFYNITQISCTSYFDELSNRHRYPQYYQLLPSESDVVYGLKEVIQHYKWRRVSLLIENNERFIFIANILRRLLLEMSNSTLEVRVTYLQLDNGSLISTNDLFPSNFRIYILLTTKFLARTIVCKAYEHGISYPKNIFLTYSMDGSNWWTTPANDSTTHNCTSRDQSSTLINSLEIVPLHKSPSTNLSGNSLTEEQYLLQYQLKLSQDRNYRQHPMSSYCFDATYSLANAINYSLQANGNLNEGSKARISLENIDFQGLTGPIYFASNGIRTSTNYQLYHFQKSTKQSLLERVPVTVISCKENNTQCQFESTEGITDSRLWPDGIPYDGIPKRKIISSNIYVTIIYGIICILGFTFAFFCLIFNFIFRGTKQYLWVSFLSTTMALCYDLSYTIVVIIRLTSPNLNYVICAGAIISYFSILLIYTRVTGQYSSTAVLCAIQLSLQPIGYSLAFITILAKLIRVYLIFRLSQKKITIKDRHLFVFITICMIIPAAIGLMFVISRSVAPSVSLDVYYEKPQSIDGARGIETQYFTFRCPIKSFERIPTAVTWVYLFILKIAALWLAFRIRKIKITGLNDSKFITAIVYISSLSLAINFVFYFTILDYTFTFNILFGSLQWISMSAIIGLTFIPKIISLYRNPKGEGLFGPQSTSNAANAVILSGPEDIQELKKKIIDLQDVIKKLQKESAANSK